MLLAENLPAESYLDTGNRPAFINGGAGVMAQPDFALRVWDAEACARLVRDGARLVAVHARLQSRAAGLGYSTSSDVGLFLSVDGRRVASMVSGKTLRFRLPENAHEVRLMSRSFVPAQQECASDVHRNLGIAVNRIAVDSRSMPLDDLRLSQGWHPKEGSWRWTNGDAVLHVTGARQLEVELAMTSLYWVSAAPTTGRHAV